MVSKNGEPSPEPKPSPILETASVPIQERHLTAISSTINRLPFRSTSVTALPEEKSSFKGTAIPDTIIKPSLPIGHLFLFGIIDFKDSSSFGVPLKNAKGVPSLSTPMQMHVFVQSIRCSNTFNDSNLSISFSAGFFSIAAKVKRIVPIFGCI